MLTYEDCLGLSELSPEEVAAIARHEHLPDIVALEMGWCLCGTPEGRRRLHQMFLDEIEDARRHGDTRRAGRLGLVLHRFIGTRPHQHAPAEVGQRAPGAGKATGGRPSHGIRFDDLAAAWMRGRDDVYMTAMLHRFGLSRAETAERFPDRMRAAAARCAACTETRRCRRFLAGLAETEAPAEFCPNAAFFAELAVPQGAAGAAGAC